MSAKRAAEQLWLRPGTVRRVAIGPMRGLRFRISAQISTARLRVFRSAYEREVVTWMCDYLQPGMTVLTVGAHVGIHAIHAARLVAPNGHVHAFEPWPDNYRELLVNIEVNGGRIAPVTPIAVAVTRESGEAVMERGDGDGSHRLSPAGEILVDAVTLDDYVAGLEPRGEVDLILVDAEGAEQDVLDGSVETLAGASPALVLEHHEADEPLRLWLSLHDFVSERLGETHLAARRR
ncbi:MAG: FkbM family methyltransferase [Solirubrobacterales bacterium]